MTSPAIREIDISIDETFRHELSEAWLRKVTSCALEVALSSGESGQVSLLVTDDATVRQLNREYRGLDEVTDVLSFSTTHWGHWEGAEDTPDVGVKADGFIFPPDEGLPLGEVIVSYPQARRQAEGRHEPIERELALLIVHGVLHLVGHDHLEADETALMQSKERAALEALFSVGTNSP